MKNLITYIKESQVPWNPSRSYFKHVIILYDDNTYQVLEFQELSGKIRNLKIVPDNSYFIMHESKG